MLQLYDKLVSLPLFLGIGNEELSGIIDHIKFGFHKLEAGKYICKEDEKCENLIFVTDGAFTIQSYSDNHSYSFEEEVSHPMIIQPTHFFGLIQRYSRTYKTKTTCNLLTLDKAEVLKIMEKSLIFRLNYLNLMSTELQRAQRLPWTRKPEDIQKAFIQFIRQHCVFQSGRKITRIKMIDLAYELHESRLNISKMLNQLKKNGLLSMSRGIIVIPQLENLR